MDAVDGILLSVVEFNRLIDYRSPSAQTQKSFPTQVELRSTVTRRRREHMEIDAI